MSNVSKKPVEAPDLRCRLALSFPEAAAVLGVSESAFRRLARQLGDIVLRAEGMPLRVSVQGLGEWVERQRGATAGVDNARQDRASRDADEVLRSLS